MGSTQMRPTRGIVAGRTRSALVALALIVAASVGAAGCDSGSSSKVAAASAPTAPTAPTGFVARAGNTTVTLSWPAVTGATSYTLYWSTTAGVTSATGTPIPGVTSPYIHAALTNNTAYSYVLTATNAVGASPDSAEVSATPSQFDLTFNGTGYVTESGTAGAAPANAYDTGHGMALDAQGRILVVGDSFDAGGRNTIAVWRFNPDGTPDTTFGCPAGSGCPGFAIASGLAGGTVDSPSAVAVDSQGRIVVVGSSLDAPSSYWSMAILRFTPQGVLDPSFNGVGYVTRTATVAGCCDWGFAVVLDSSGRIVVAGQTASGFEWAVWRYNADGTPDITFNGGGWIAGNGEVIPGGGDSANAVTLDAAGNILIAGVAEYTSSPSTYAMAVWRITPGGALDPTYGCPAGTGCPGYSLFASPFAGYSASASAIRVGPAGRILTAGYSYDATGTSLATVWRFAPNGTLDSSFGCSAGSGCPGYLTQGSGNATNANDGGLAMTLDAFGRIVVTGYSSDLVGNDGMALWRFNPNGTLDTTFNATGAEYQWTSGGSDYGYALALDSGGHIVVAGRGWTGSNWVMVTWRVNP